MYLTSDQRRNPGKLRGRGGIRLLTDELVGDSKERDRLMKALLALIREEERERIMAVRDRATAQRENA